MVNMNSAVAERPRDALFPAVISFNSIIRRAQCFVIVTWASDLPLRIKRCSVVCCLQRNVEASCHKHFVVVSRH